MKKGFETASDQLPGDTPIFLPEGARERLSDAEFAEFMELREQWMRDFEHVTSDDPEVRQLAYWEMEERASGKSPEERAAHDEAFLARKARYNELRRKLGIGVIAEDSVLRVE